MRSLDVKICSLNERSSRTDWTMAIFFFTESTRRVVLPLEYKEKFAVLTARALSKLVSLIELASPLLKKGGRLVCYKAQLSSEELDEALAVQDLVGMRMISQREICLSDGETMRTIVVFEKVGKSRIKLPRRIGLAQNPTGTSFLDWSTVYHRLKLVQAMFDRRIQIDRVSRETRSI